MIDVKKSCFQFTKLLKINITIRSIKRERTFEYFKIWFRDVGTIARLFELPFDNNAFHSSNHANKLPYKETVIYFVWLGNMKDVQKSLFQFTKMQKMKIMKDSTKQYRTVVSCNIWCRHVVMNARMF